MNLIHSGTDIGHYNPWRSFADNGHWYAIVMAGAAAQQNGGGPMYGGGRGQRPADSRYQPY